MDVDEVPDEAAFRAEARAWLEALRSIVAERVLGLPKAPRPDQGVPFRDVVASGAGR